MNENENGLNVNSDDALNFLTTTIARNAKDAALNYAYVQSLEAENKRLLAVIAELKESSTQKKGAK